MFFHLYFPMFHKEHIIRKRNYFKRNNSRLIHFLPDVETTQEPWISEITSLIQFTQWHIFEVRLPEFVPSLTKQHEWEFGFPFWVKFLQSLLINWDEADNGSQLFNFKAETRVIKTWSPEILSKVQSHQAKIVLGNTCWNLQFAHASSPVWPFWPSVKATETWGRAREIFQLTFTWVLKNDFLSGKSLSE